MTSQLERGKTTDTAANSFKPAEKWRIWRNILVLGFAFMLQFTAFWGTSNLQSSVNAEQALGTYTLASIYGTLLLSNILLPAIVIRWFSCKWTMVISSVAFVPFISAQFYPRFSVMIPAGIFVALGSGPLWCAKCTFISVVSKTYSQITGTPVNIVVTRFFGVFYMFYQLSQLWGNIISSTVLSSGNRNALDEKTIASTFTNVTYLNDTVLSRTNFYPKDVEDICGANFCPDTTLQVNPNLIPPAVEKIQLIAGIYLACIVTACLCISFGVDSLKRYEKTPTRSAHGLSNFRLLTVTLKQALVPYQILIIPITMFIGAEGAFLTAEYTASFVACSWGISNIGYVMICFGVTNALSSILIGGIVKQLGRNPIMVFGLILQLSIFITLLAWRPHPGNKLTFFLIAALWGLTDAIWIVQINVLNGILFPGREEAAYSNFKLWEAFGAVVAYIYSPYLCTRIKLCLLIGLLLIGVVGYTTLEVRIHKNKNEALGQGKGEYELCDDNGSRNLEVPY